MNVNAGSKAGLEAPARSASTLIALDGVSKAFPTPTGEIDALTPIDLRIGAGEFVTLIGPSGCGKTTALRMVADLEKPSSGTISIGGKTPVAARRNREIGFVFQQAALLEWRSAAANVALPLEVSRTPRAARAGRVREMLSLVGLEEFADRRPRQLSGGMQQRIAIARALVTSPKVLLMDEPFGALDEITRDRLNLELLNIVAQTKTTVVFVTHSIREAVFLSDRVIVISPRPGRIVEELTVPFNRPRDLSVRETSIFNDLSNRGLRLLESGFVERVA